MSATLPTWEPLPKRVRRGTSGARSGGGAAAAAASEADEGNDGAPTDAAYARSSSSNAAGAAAGGGGGKRGPMSAVQAQIDANIERRAHSARAETTLADMDGCRGEFYEYLDHTADVQLHAWGADLKTALENIVPCMFNYMTDLRHVREDPGAEDEFVAEGHDMLSLLFAYLDEFLFRFSSEGAICRRASILDLRCQDSTYAIRVRSHGERFDASRHNQGTEVKAITYSNMQIRGVEAGAGGLVAANSEGEEEKGEAAAGASGGGPAASTGRVDIFVIVDI